MKIKQVLIFIFASIIGGTTVFMAGKYFIHEKAVLVEVPAKTSPVHFVSSNYSKSGLDFTTAAERTIDAVVHVKTQYSRTEYENPLFEIFFGNRGYTPQPIEGSGSGVIISSDGYIVTNNHVIAKSDHIEVILNDKRSFPAKLIGTDPSTDIALLKVEQTELPSLTYGDSDNLRIGEWVLAVGNPFNLNSTVTAGIVSAKARNINILNQEYAIESFIQTDAAVNPGNSGGALVNIKGELIGINTAIASRTGSFTGYSFAVPVNIAKKVVSDLIEFGSVQRGLLGVSIRDLDAQSARYLGIDKIEGVYVSGVGNGGAADISGIREGDLITEIEGIKIDKISELQEQISKYRPGDKIKITIKRKQNIKTVNVVLQNKMGNTNLVRSEVVTSLGAKFEEISKEEMNRLNIEHGIKVAGISAGKLLKAGVEEGLIITYINRQAVHKIADIKNILQNHHGGVYIEGIYPNGVTAYYAFGMNSK